MLKTIAQRAFEVLPPVRRLRSDRERLRKEARKAHTRASKYEGQASRLREQLKATKTGNRASLLAASSPARLDARLQKFDKINFGCGYDKRDGFLNVDVDPKCAPDLLILDGDYSVIPRNHYTEILANDVLEHISHQITLAVLLDWADFLTSAGRLHIQTSSILGVAEQLRSTNRFREQIGWTYCLFGNQAHAGDFHHVGFTEATLRTNLIAAGYGIDSFEVKDDWLFHVDCHKLFTWTDVLEATRSAGDEEFIRTIYTEALGREPDDKGRAHLARALGRRTMTRKGALKHLMQSRERLYVTAARNDL